MSSPAYDIATYIHSQELAGLGNNMFCFTMPDSPDETVSIYDTGGFPNQPNYDYQRPTVMVKVRSGRGDALGGFALAETIRNLILTMFGVTVSTSKFIGSWLISDITQLNEDENRRFLFSFNIRLHRTTITGD